MQHRTNKPVAAAALVTRMAHLQHPELPLSECANGTMSSSSNGGGSTTDGSVMSRLWLRMTEMFGSRWTSQYGESDEGTWGKALANVDHQVLARAVSRCAHRGGDQGWPPSLPEFLALCRVEAGLPDCHTAYVDASQHRWTHVVVYETARRVGVFEVRSRDEKAIWPAWRDRYEEVCAAWMAGEEFSRPLGAQQQIGYDATEKQPPVGMTREAWAQELAKSPEQRQQEREALMRKLGGKNHNNETRGNA